MAVLQTAREKQFEKLFYMYGSFADCREKQFEKLFYIYGSFADCPEKKTR